MTNELDKLGFVFNDRHLGEAMLVQRGDFAGWICKRLPGGGWMTIRRATPQDIETVQKLMAIVN